MINKLKSTGKLWLIVLSAVVGVALLLFGGSEKSNREEEYGGVDSLASYCETTEKKIRELCSKVEGVSDVSVAVSFEGGFESVYARNDDDGDVVVIGSGSNKNAVKIKEKAPEIKGVGVVCRGGGDPVIQQKLLKLISAAFGISSNKIYVVEAQK